MKITLLYTIFAAISIFANIGSQDLSLRLYSGQFSLHVSIFIGTAIGLAVKYLLDKKYIFRYQTRDIGHDTYTFVLYTAMGIFTTAIFWGFEYSFDYIFQTLEMRYTGGVLGLIIGYLIKYRLDKRFVFVSK